MPQDSIDWRGLLGGGLASLTSLLVGQGCGTSSSPGEGVGSPDSASPDAPLEDASADAPMDACNPMTCTDDANTLVIDLSTHPGLARSGGSMVLTDARYTDPLCQQNVIIVAQPSPGAFIAFSASCTHACCTVSFTGSEFACPCHGSLYNLKGKVIQGPAPLALPSVPVCTDGCGRVFLQLK